MGGTFFRWIISISVLCFIGTSHAVSLKSQSSRGECAFYLNSQWYTESKKLVERVREVNPDLAMSYLLRLPSDQTLVELYLILKEEAWAKNPHGSLPWNMSLELSESLKSHLIQNFGERYNLAEATDKELYLFYINALHGLYAFVYGELKTQFLQSLGWENSKALFVGRDQLDDLFPLHGLSTRALSPERARELLEQDLGSREHWNSLYSEFGSNDSGDAHSSKTRSKLCCLSTPACTQCPHNRGLLKKNSNG